MLHSLEIAGAGMFALLGASLIVVGLAWWTRAAAVHRPSRRGTAVFLFEGQHLVDATPAARRLLPGRRRGGPDLAELLALLARDFGADLGPRLAALPTAGRLLLASVTGAGTLEAAEEGGALRLTLRPDEDGGTAIDRLSLEAAREELELLRGLAEAAPQPIWMLDEAGALTWANRAYLDLADRANASPGAPAGAARATWPAAPLFGESPGPAEGQPHEQRCPLALPGWEEPLWFDVTSLRRGAGSLHFATDVTGLVQAESARLHFVQTLGKTFAQLSTGLAVFDRERRLVLFNPAFPDLTGLPIDFLIGRPPVHAVLDRLRDARILPEPRDYASWRESVAALEAAAAKGDYRETWALPGGRTWRVTGRPHPDGALAFLFENISDEVGLTRRLRAELDTLRGVLDSLDEATAVFSANGALLLSNAAYAELWGAPDETGLAGEIARWEAACAPSSLWARLRERTGEALAIPGEGLRRLDGRVLGIRISALPRGATLVAFRAEPKASPLPDGQPDRIAPGRPAPAGAAEFA